MSKHAYLYLSCKIWHRYVCEQENCNIILDRVEWKIPSEFTQLYVPEDSILHNHRCEDLDYCTCFYLKPEQSTGSKS
jgi:hypothetical protein